MIEKWKKWKTKLVPRITLINDKKNFHKQNIKIAKAFNNYYINIAISNMTTNQEYECLDSEEDDPVLKIIGKY